MSETLAQVGRDVEVLYAWLEAVADGALEGVPPAMCARALRVVGRYELARALTGPLIEDGDEDADPGPGIDDEPAVAKRPLLSEAAQRALAERRRAAATRRSERRMAHRRRISAVEALLRDEARSGQADRIIAAKAGCSRSLVRIVRGQLAGATQLAA